MHGRGPKLGRGALVLLALVMVLPWASTALGDSGVNPPAVTTGSALEVTKTTAELTATVNPLGPEVTICEFEYGTSPAATEASVPCASLPGAGTLPVAVSAVVEHLTPNDTYYFQNRCHHGRRNRRRGTGLVQDASPTRRWPRPGKPVKSS